MDTVACSWYDLKFRNGQEYEKLRELEPEPDMIFYKLELFTGGQDKGTPIYEAAVLAVLAYFFEQCDIFEQPPTGVIS